MKVLTLVVESCEATKILNKNQELYMEIANINNIKKVLSNYEGDMVCIEFFGNVSENFYIESFGFKELKNFQIKIFDCEDRENVHNPFCINWLDIENIKVEDDICKITFIGWNQFITIQKV